MKKLLLSLILLSASFIYSSNNVNKFLGVLPSGYAPNSGKLAPLLVYIEKNLITNKIQIEVTPYDKRRLDLANQLGQRLSSSDTLKYLKQITAEITKYRKELPKII